MLVKIKTVDELGAILGPAEHSGPDKAPIDKLVELADHIAASKEIADSLENPFLTYMLDMTLQAVRMEMRPKALRAYRKPR